MGAKGGTTLVCEHENYSVISMYKTETDEMTKKNNIKSNEHMKIRYASSIKRYTNAWQKTGQYTRSTNGTKNRSVSHSRFIFGMCQKSIIRLLHFQGTVQKKKRTKQHIKWLQAKLIDKSDLWCAHFSLSLSCIHSSYFINRKKM